MDKDKLKQIKNHLSHVKAYVDAFLVCAELETDEEDERTYLLDILSRMKNLINETKDIIK